jgi:MYXO-CTERM domain-containing protein
MSAHTVIALIVDEGKWLTFSMGLALLGVAVLLAGRRRRAVPVRRRLGAAMNLFFGITIGSMAFGHLLAVTTKLLVGTLDGSTAKFYAIGVALAVPSWWLIAHTPALLASDDQHGAMTLRLNAWLGLTLVALGLPNLPLALPAVFNIAYHLQPRRAVGWAIVSLAVVVNVGLFIGSLVFLASGQSFEQFRGIE